LAEFLTFFSRQQRLKLFFQPSVSRPKSVFSRKPAAEFCSAVDQAQSAVSRD
jgi:hypothetical protein